MYVTDIRDGSNYMVYVMLFMSENVEDIVTVFIHLFSFFLYKLQNYY